MVVADSPSQLILQALTEHMKQYCMCKMLFLSFDKKKSPQLYNFSAQDDFNPYLWQEMQWALLNISGNAKPFNFQVFLLV